VKIKVRAEILDAQRHVVPARHIDDNTPAGLDPHCTDRQRHSTPAGEREQEFRVLAIAKVNDRLEPFTSERQRDPARYVQYSPSPVQ
jgi:hypothetical protein